MKFWDDQQPPKEIGTIRYPSASKRSNASLISFFCSSVSGSFFFPRVAI